jgi:hypothetical protein
MRWIAPTENSTAAATSERLWDAADQLRGSRVDEPAAYQAEGVLYLAPETRS